MSLALAPSLVVRPRASAPAVPAAFTLTLAFTALALLARAVSIDAFLGITTVGFTAATAWPIVRAARRGWDAGDVLPMFVLYYSLSLLLRGLADMTFLDSPYIRDLGDAQTAHVRDLLGWTFLYSALGLVAAVLGYDAPLGARWTAAIARAIPAVGRRWRTARLGKVTAAMIAIGTAGALVRVHGPAGFLRAASNPMATSGEDALGFWWLIAITEFAVVGVHAHLIGLLLRRDRRFFAHYLLLGLGLGVPIYLMSSSKFLLLRLLFLPWLYRHFLVRRVPIWRILGGFAVFGALFPFFYAYRALGILGLEGVSAYLDNTDLPMLKMFTRSYGADSFMLIIHRTGHTLPFRFGGTFADFATFWIPRLLWPGKPVSFGLTFPVAYMPDVHWGSMTYVTASLPGELYMNFHAFGVVAGCALLGVAMRASRGLADLGPGGLLIYGYAFLTAMHLVEGCIASQMETFLTHLVPSVLALALVTARTGARPEVRA